MEYATHITTDIDPFPNTMNDVETDSAETIHDIIIGGINHVDSIERRQNLIKTSEIFVVKYGAEWCGPCKKTQPEFLKMAISDSSGKCIYASEDIDDEFGEHPEPIRSIPTFHIYKKGVFERSLGGTDLNKVHDIIEMLKR
jgi:thioredoxin 1